MLITVAVCPCGHVGETVMYNLKPCVSTCQIIIILSIHFIGQLHPKPIFYWFVASPRNASQSINYISELSFCLAVVCVSVPATNQ